MDTQNGQDISSSIGYVDATVEITHLEWHECSSRREGSTRTPTSCNPFTIKESLNGVDTLFEIIQLWVDELYK